MIKTFLCEYCGAKYTTDDTEITAFRCMNCWNWNDIADMSKPINRICER